MRYMWMTCVSVFSHQKRPLLQTETESLPVRLNESYTSKATVEGAAGD